MKVYELIQFLSKYSADASVEFEIEGTFSGFKKFKDSQLEAEDGGVFGVTGKIIDSYGNGGGDHPILYGKINED